MMRCAGSQGTGFACMVAGMQELLDAARSVCAVVFALAAWIRSSYNVVRGAGRACSVIPQAGSAAGSVRPTRRSCQGSLSVGR
jgi:hypothetical protein